MAEQLALEQGRQLIQRNLEASLRQQAAAVEKKERRDDSVPVGDGEPIADAKHGQ